jgi:hypothetical protein
MADSVQELGARFARPLWILEMISVAIVTAEYFVRLWIAPENPLYAQFT